MGIALRRLGGHGVNLVVYHGRIDRDELIGFYRGIDPKDPANALPWLTYIAPDADLSEIDVAALTELRRVFEPVRQSVVARKNFYVSVIVSASERSDEIVAFWHDFVAKDSDYAPHTILFSEIKAACDDLNLPSSAPEAIANALRTVVPSIALTP